MRGKLLCLIVALARSSTVVGGAPAALVITDVNVLPMDLREVTPAQTVVIRDGIISKIGDAVSVAVPHRCELKYQLPKLLERNKHS